MMQGREEEALMEQTTGRFDDVARYEALMEVVRRRMTNRAFAPWDVPRAHFERLLD